MSLELQDNPLLLKLEFLSIFRLAREKYTLKELSDMLGIDIPTLSKYANAQLVPSIKRIKELIPLLLKVVNPLEEIRISLTSGGFAFPELNNILNTKPYLLGWIAIQTIRRLSTMKFNTILSVEGGGLAYAAFLATLTGKRLVYGIRDVFIEGGITETYTLLESDRYSPKMKKYITIPKNSIRKDDRVIIVDDISWSGGTIHTLYKLAKKAKADILGIFLIAIFDDTLEMLRDMIDVDIEPLIVVPRQ